MADVLHYITLVTVIANQILLSLTMYFMFKRIDFVLSRIRKLECGMGRMQSNTFVCSPLARRQKSNGNEVWKASSDKGDQSCR